MSRIVHLALKVDDLERTAEFYRKVFGFVEVNTEKVRDHTSRHLSDGRLDVALINTTRGRSRPSRRRRAKAPASITSRWKSTISQPQRARSSRTAARSSAIRA